MSTRSPRLLLQLAAAVTLSAVALVSTSCTTTYDAYGRPQQSVDPGVAIAGVAAAGLAGYALSNSNNHNNHRHARPPYYGSGGYAYYGAPYRRSYHH
jgi:hypothetical protein